METVCSLITKASSTTTSPLVNSKIQQRKTNEHFRATHDNDTSQKTDTEVVNL